MCVYCVRAGVCPRVDSTVPVDGTHLHISVAPVAADSGSNI